MGKILSLTAILAVLFVSIINAQETSGVSKEDLKHSTDEIKSIVKQELTKAAEKAARDREQARILHEKELKESQQREAGIRAENELRIKEQQKANEAGRKAIEETKSTQQKIAAGIGLVVVILIGLAVMIYKKRKPETVVVMKPEKVQGKSEAKNLIDPEIPTLREIAKQTGQRKLIILITLPQEKAQISCVAELRDNLDPVVYFQGITEPVAWEKRRKKAAEIYSRNNQKRMAS